MSHSKWRAMAEAYVLGALPADDRARVEAHEAECAVCRAAVDEALRTLEGMASALPPVPPPSELRTQLLDLAEAPRWPIDLDAFEWEEPMPGVRTHLLKEEPERGVRKCLVWAQPGAKSPPHRHGGDECILVLKGALKDERGKYRAGEVCRSREGSTHTEEVVPGEDCVCYVVYYGPLEYL